MRKIILLLLMYLPLCTWAQEEFSIDKWGYGIVKTNDNSKFIIKSYPGIKAIDLYKAVGLGIEKTGHKDKKVNSIEGVSIAVEDIEKYALKVQKEFYEEKSQNLQLS